VTLARGEHDAMNTGEQLTRLGVPAVTLPGLGHNAHVQAQVLGREVLEFAAWTCGPASGKFRPALRRPGVMRLDAALRPRLCHQARRLGPSPVTVGLAWLRAVT
jgi:hypothetical protein